MTEQLVTWLYAVASAATAGGTGPLKGRTGVAGEPVRVIEGTGGTGEVEGLAAVVGSVPLKDFDDDAMHEHLQDLRWLERSARSHHQVIGEASRHGPVIPLRFGTLFHDDDGVRDMLADRETDLAAALERVAGRTEWGVKAFADPKAFLPDPSEEPAEGGGDKPGTAYLLRRRAQRKEKETAHLRVTRQAEEIHAALSEVAVESAEHPPQDAGLAAYEGWMILNNSYLVADEHTADFLARVSDLKRRLTGTSLELSGPWPPYSFTALPESEHEPGSPGSPGSEVR
ncbi:GvpL/GvpF family gas vesicle protein [Streptomyces montanus]|uniref:GvpL/GvpF family gas vesicle protein n=1 Tax=Streptomyces montanus TaxID=2580423 RepID=A0A5R9FKZ8_9ACTN|nr:GvpL/GvpF family gas vesicle protein [Streptomyces montanus]TLS44537.1 GvpL/GvpF family gas vesicle protein [Streptomyces montanus]